MVYRPYYYGHPLITGTALPEKDIMVLSDPRGGYFAVDNDLFNGDYYGLLTNNHNVDSGQRNTNCFGML